jgi:glucosylceramidase
MARPDKNLYFTEQMVVENNAAKSLNVVEPVKDLIINAARNWSKNVLLWNLAADADNKPHTNDGGCPMCQGAITIEGNDVSFNIAYYAVVHASKFVRPGSVRIKSTYPGDAAVAITKDEEQPTVIRIAQTANSDVLPNVAYKTPEGKIVLIAANDKNTTQHFRIQYNGMMAYLKLDAGAVGTFVW